MALNFSWILDGRVAGMARPRPEDGAWLREQGVTGIVSLTERAPPLDGFLSVHLPVRDMTSPSLGQLHRAVGFMRGVVTGGGAVVAHCGAGLGRTGTVLAAYLVGEGDSVEAAIARVRRIRPGSIETPGQEIALHHFAELAEGAA